MLRRIWRQIGDFRLHVSLVLGHVPVPLSATEAQQTVEDHAQDLRIVFFTQHKRRFLNRTLGFSRSSISTWFVSFWHVKSSSGCQGPRFKIEDKRDTCVPQTMNRLFELVDWIEGNLKWTNVHGPSLKEDFVFELKIRRVAFRQRASSMCWRWNCCQPNWSHIESVRTVVVRESVWTLTEIFYCALYKILWLIL